MVIMNQGVMRTFVVWYEPLEGEPRRMTARGELAHAKAAAEDLVRWLADKGDAGHIVVRDRNSGESLASYPI